jgi:hypothetical protein
MLDALPATPFWRDHARRRYSAIRARQAKTLLPLQTMLDIRGFAGIEGSLISPETIHMPRQDSPVYLEKRLNYVLLMDQLQCKRVLEIGFNWGYSASLLLEVTSDSRLHSIDIAMHDYTPPAGELIAGFYPERFTCNWKDSKTALEDEIRAGNRYDAISIDGGHDYATATSDIVLSLQLLDPGGLLIIDDTDAPSVAGAVLATIEDHPDMIELTPANFNLFAFGDSEIPCFQQRYFLKRTPISAAATPAPALSFAARAAGRLRRLFGA